MWQSAEMPNMEEDFFSANDAPCILHSMHAGKQGVNRTKVGGTGRRVRVDALEGGQS